MKDKMMNYNKVFVENEMYKGYITSKFPDKQSLIVTCMDTRLTELLPAAMGVNNGEVKMVKNAGGLITSKYGSVMRSIIVGIHSFDIREIFVIGHSDCGMHDFDLKKLQSTLESRGITQKEIDLMKEDGIDAYNWIQGFHNIEDNIISSIKKIKTHPLVPSDVAVYGYIIDSVTGELKEIEYSDEEL